MMLPRKSNWPEALAAYVESRRNMPFQWGVNDCCMFAAGAVEAMTGVNPAADLVGTYGSRRGAARHLARYNGDLSIAAIAHLGQAIDVLLARRGDILLVKSRDDASPNVSVWLGDGWVAPGKNGLEFGDRSRAVFAWRV